MTSIRQRAIAGVLLLLSIAAWGTAAFGQADLQALDRRMAQFLGAGNYAAALVEARKIEAMIRTRFGEDYPTYAQALNNVAFLLAAQGDYAEAEAAYKKAIALAEKRRGPDDIQVARFLNTLAAMHVSQSRYGDAEAAMLRALAIVEKVLPDSDPFYAKMLNDFAVLSEQQGKYGKAEELYRRAIPILERVKGANNVDVARGLGNLAVIYHHLGRYDEAARLHARAQPILEKALGRNHPDLATSLGNRAGLLMALERYKEAEEGLKRSLAIREKTFGSSHPDVAQVLAELALVYDEQGRQGDAEAARQRALAIYEKFHGPDHPDVANILNSLAVVASLQKRNEEAERLLSRALPIYEKALGADHPRLEGLNSNFAYVLAVQGRHQAALERARASTGALSTRAAEEAPSLRREGQETRIAQGNTGSYRVHLMALAGLARQEKEKSAALAHEGFEVAQGATHSSASAALQQMANRFAGGGGSLATLIRHGQDFLVLKREVDKAIVSAMSKPGGQKDRATFEGLRKQLDEKINDNAAFIERDFPDYTALTRPKPLKVEEAQKLLETDEALVFIQLGYTESYVFAVTRDNIHWAIIPLDAKQLAEKVAGFRRGLNVEDLSRAIQVNSRRQLFDLAAAHELYVTLLGPVEGVIRDKRHLLVVPSGALTALPFHLLLTERSAASSSHDEVNEQTLAFYRDAPWLLRRHAITVLPSVASLKALRVFGRKEQAGKAMVGFGDPIFDAEKEKHAGAPAQGREAKTRAYTDFWQGAGIDRTKLAQSLPRLADTADELKAIAASLRAGPEDIFLRAAASETAVKSAQLGDYRVVYFATHGLVAGDVNGLAEPSLALTVPQKPTDKDDGLLTAGEIAELRLNADWVVLSACNTIAGERPGAEALSGLARAFFYAGARAILVTHWAVDSAAATRLATTTFGLMETSPKLGRSEALRQAMLTYLEDRTNPSNAYPAMWAPFVIIGEGRER